MATHQKHASPPYRSAPFAVCLAIGIGSIVLGLAVLVTIGGIGAVSIMCGSLSMTMCAFLIRSQRHAPKT